MRLRIGAASSMTLLIRDATPADAPAIHEAILAMGRAAIEGLDDAREPGVFAVEK